MICTLYIYECRVYIDINNKKGKIKFFCLYRSVGFCINLKTDTQLQNRLQLNHKLFIYYNKYYICVFIKIPTTSIKVKI